MRKMLLVIGMVVVALPAFADGRQEIDLTVEIIEAEGRVLTQLMVLPAPHQEKEFWKVYESYRKKVDALDRRTAAVINEFAGTYGSLVHDQSKRLAREAAEIDKDRVAARKKCVRNLHRILTPKQVARFLQLESKIDAVVRLEMALLIPYNR